MFAAIFRLVRACPALLAIAMLPAQVVHAADAAVPANAETAKPAIAIPVAAQTHSAPQATVQQAPAPAAPAADLPPSGLAARAADESAADALTPARAEPATAAAAEEVVTWRKEELVGAAQDVFGKGASGLAEMIEDLLRKQGEPNGYIVGREGGGALFFGLRYGSGTLHHKVEGQRPVYWTGPSLGLDLGANAAKTFVLVYNLYDTEELYSRFGAGEGQAYLVGGFHVSYLRQGDKVLIPVRSGAGLRLGINAGYMKFSHRQKILPF